MNVRSRGFALVIALAACDQGERRPPEPSVTVASGFKDLPAFPEPSTDKMPYDCSITGVFEKLLPAVHVETCGLLGPDATESDRAAAVDCMKRAGSSRRPYFLAEEIQGTDSVLARAHLISFEGDVRVMYEADFDSDPCGGSCGDRGGTEVRRCRLAPEASNVFASNRWEHECEDGEVVESCAFGNPGVFPRAFAEGMSNALLGDSPATLAAAFGPVRIGAPRSVWESANVRRFVSMIESGGLVSVGDDRWTYQGGRIEALLVLFAGPCSRVRALLQEKWGPSTGDSWVNRTLHQRAQLELKTCRLRVERMADP